jgi:hypothetical protein
MTRTQRLLALASFLVSLIVLMGIASILGGLGAIELVICVIVAVPVSVVVNRALVRRLGRPGAPG